MTMILELKENYGINNPFLIEDIQNDFEYSYTTIKTMISEYIKKNELKRYDKGIYYFPKKSEILGESIPAYSKVLEHKFIENNSKIFGYYTGIYLLNKIGLTTQVPLRREITTNIETNIKRKVGIGDREVFLRKPLVKVTNENVKYLQFMDIFRYAYDSEIKEHKDCIIKFIKENKLNKEDLKKYTFKYYPNKAKAKLLETGCWDEIK